MEIIITSMTRISLIALLPDGDILLFGGEGEEDGRYYNDVFRFCLCTARTTLRYTLLFSAYRTMNS
jgi:hypothetical protein